MSARYVLRSPAWATAPAAWCRACTTIADAKPEDNVPGLMHVDLGGYHVSDLEFVAAFDVDADKVGKDLSEALFSGQNNTYRFSAVPYQGVTVQRGPTLDGLGKYLRQVITESDAEPVDVAQVLRDARADVLINYLPVGSEDGVALLCRAGAAGGRRVRQLHPGLHCLRTRRGRAVRGEPGCPSSATTSRARSAQPSPTACSPACSRTAACASTAPTSSTSAATPTS